MIKIALSKGRIFKEFNSGKVTQEDVLIAASGIEESNKEGN